MKKILILIVFTLLISGCATHVGFEQAVKMEPLGFWYGLIHGLILPFSFLVSLFDNSVSIYAIYNNGVWYNLGFILGVSSTFSGGAKAT